MSDLLQALEAAKLARDNAHAPYSNFHVGAAIKVKGCDELFAGCNVENASYGATICAERSAISSVISELGKVELEYLVLVTETDPPGTPCGMCLQVLSEFCTPDFPIHLATPDGIKNVVTLGALLPLPFDRTSLE